MHVKSFHLVKLKRLTSFRNSGEPEIKYPFVTNLATVGMLRNPFHKMFCLDKNCFVPLSQSASLEKDGNTIKMNNKKKKRKKKVAYKLIIHLTIQLLVLVTVEMTCKKQSACTLLLSHTKCPAQLAKAS